MSILQYTKCHTCRSEFEVQFSIKDVRNGILPAPPEFCKVCEGDQQICINNTKDVVSVEEEEQGQVADGLLTVTCQDCKVEYKLGFNADQLLQGTISTKTTWRCTKCKGSRVVKPFIFEILASGAIPCPHRAAPPTAPLREMMEQPVREPGVFDALWQVDCNGNTDL
eukprot:GGOE01003271.1.p1 GENE.GGOE01003271.1~~GGOE01003271.1.p1  ORF type:complete len:167 (+),score=6.13 GGOE01003271.1:31-531(+)